MRLTDAIFNENRCFVIAIVITAILLMFVFSAGRGASLGGIALVGASSYYAARSVVYL